MVRQNNVALLTYHRLVTSDARTAHNDVPLVSFKMQMAEVSGRTHGATGPVMKMKDGTHLCITFDDGTADHLGGAEVLNSHRLHGVFFVVFDRLDTKGHLGRADVRDLARNGHTIGSHTLSHRNIAKLGLDQQREECERSRSALEDLIGEAVDWFAFPGGAFSSDAMSAAESAGYKIMRTMEWGYARLPLRGRTMCWPVFGHHGDEAFRRILDGRARPWPYRIKQGAKKLLPSGAYTRLRDHAFVRGQ